MFGVFSNIWGVLTAYRQHFHLYHIILYYSTFFCKLCPFINNYNFSCHSPLILIFLIFYESFPFFSCYKQKAIQDRDDCDTNPSWQPEIRVNSSSAWFPLTHSQSCNVKWSVPNIRERHRCSLTPMPVSPIVVISS